MSGDGTLGPFEKTRRCRYSLGEGRFDFKASPPRFSELAGEKVLYAGPRSVSIKTLIYITSRSPLGPVLV
jgi:hypothetical protein